MEEKIKTQDGKSAKLAAAMQEKEKINYRGRVFEGAVVKKFPRRVVIEFERVVYVKKYERYTHTKTKIHARLPREIEDKINVGDYVRIGECRPLSKLIHFIVLEKIKDKEEK